MYLACQNLEYLEHVANEFEFQDKRLIELSCLWIVVGYQERLNDIENCNEVIEEQLEKLSDMSLNAIICVGDTLKVHEEKRTKESLEE